MENDESRLNDISKFDQAASFLADSFPLVWRRIYSNLLQEGFDEEQAMSLLRTYIVASHNTSGINT